MSTIHPHWQSTDDTPVPVRVAAPKHVPVIPAGAKTVSRRPAAVVGILLTLSIGVVAYGTLDDDTSPLAGELMGMENPTTYFDVLAEQMVRAQIEKDFGTPPDDQQVMEELVQQGFSDEEIPPQTREASIPVNTAATMAALSASIPVNRNTIGSPSTESFHSGAPRPIEQPQTGAEMLWITLLGAMAGLVWKSREMLRC
ncbi:MAG: hypothetical protein AAB544_00685 [Patescibacteria group bacterium]